MLRLESSGSWKGTFSFLEDCQSDDILDPAVALAEAGVQRLKDATPKESGETAAQWTYEVVREGGQTIIWFNNTHEVDGFNVAVGLQYGHGTGGGGWVEGYDYINPALKPIFDEMSAAAWKGVTTA